MSITKEQLIHISRNLSKLNLQDPERLSQDINSILSYIDLLSGVNTDNIEPTISVINQENKLKDDKQIKEIEPKELLACSKQKVIGNQIAVSDIMK